MNESEQNDGTSPSPSRKEALKRLWTMVAFSGVLFLMFLPFLVTLFRFALQSNLYSHILLVPAISAWFLWERRRQLPEPSPERVPLVAPVILLLVATGIAYWLDGVFQLGLDNNDRLFVTMSIFVTTLLSGVVLILGPAYLRAILFPALFLYFLAPIPSVVLHAFNVLLQHLTGWTLAGLLWLTPTPVLQDGLSFHFPGFSLHIAEECSGVRSTLVLLITTLVAGALFLRSPWRRALLTACFLPIAALRNAARILSLAMGTLYIDPGILDGPLHRRGGTPFFALSLIPLFAIVLFLRKVERDRIQTTQV